VVENVLKQLASKFGQDAQLTTSRGKVLDYLGMKMNYRKRGKMMFSMVDYIKRGKNASCLSSVQCNRQRQETTRRKSTIVSPHCSKNIIHMQKNMTRHKTASN